MNQRNRPQWTIWTAALLCVVMALGLALIAGGIRRLEPEDPIVRVRPDIPQEAGPETQPLESEEPTDPSEPETQPPTEPPTQPPETEPEGEDNPTDPTESTDPGLDDDTAPSDPNQGSDDPDGPTVPGGDGDGEVTDDELHIVTDLSNRVITFDELSEDNLGFYAYIANGEPDMYLRVKIRNSQTSLNGTYLSAEGRNYQTKLARQENNYITIYLKQGEKTVSEVTYVIRYVAKSASAEDPSVGDHPPIVTTNLDDFEGTMTNRNFTFLVTARTHDEQVIYSSSIIVTMDGVTLKNPTGSNVFEYELTFPDPVDGDFEDHTITVLVWDNNGNSAYREFTVTYGFKDSGSVVGTAYIYVDATTVGLDTYSMGGGYAYEIKQDEPASYAVIAALEYMGYEVEYARTLDEGLYIRRLSRGGMCDYAQVPDNLWQKVLDDGIALTGQRYADSLGEHDYTQGSGWMYALNGTLYAGKGLSEYYLSDGDTVYLRFTLAYGKDIGGYTSGYGTLSTYCGIWINGGYTDLHQWSDSAVVREATCTEPGLEARTCAVCADEDPQGEIPALGHDFQEIARQEPTEDTDGYIESQCTRCAETTREVIPRPTEPDPTDPEPTDPEPTDPEPTDPEPTEPEPTEPEPTEPDPTEPKPSEPTRRKRKEQEEEQ